MIATNPFKFAQLITSVGISIASNVSYYLGYQEDKSMLRFDN